MRFRAILAAAVVLFGTAVLTVAMVLPVGGMPPPRISPTVLVTILGGHGSGVVLDGGYVLTAAHVARVSPDKIMLSTEAGVDTVDVEVLWVNNQFDIALLKVRDVEFLKPIGAARMNCREVSVGTKVRAEGNPFTARFVAQWGKIGSAPQSLGHWRSVFSIGAPLAPGMSGGPVFDKKGRVVGINVGIGPVGGFYVAVPSSVACMLMGRA